MKKKLPGKFILLSMLVSLVAFSVPAQNKIRSADDLHRIQQLKSYQAAHPATTGIAKTANKMKQVEELMSRQPSSTVKSERIRSSNNTAFVPVNDDCANAALITENSTCIPTVGDVADATEELAVGTCIPDVSPNAYDVWFQFVAVTSDPIISVTGSSSFDAVIFLLDGCGGTEIGCSDATFSGGTESILATGLTPGNTYFIRVYDYGSALPATTTFDICVQSQPSVPANDACASATALTMAATCSPVSASIGAATEDGIPGCAGTADDDVWFSFVATTTSARVTVAGSEGFDVVLEAFDGCGGTSLGCSDNFVNTFETLDLAVAIGNTYYIRVFSYDAVPVVPGNFDICVQELPPPPVNDTMCGAIELFLNGAVEIGDINYVSATEYPGDSIVTALGYSCSTPNNTLWYSYNAASADSFYVVYTADLNFEAWLGVFTSDNAASPCLGNLVYNDCLAGPFSTGGPDTSLIGFLPAAPGTTYLFMIDGVSGSVGPFSISVIPAPSTVGIASVVNHSSFSLYPNPSKGIFTVHLNGVAKKSSIRLYDVIGNLMSEEVIENSNETKIDASLFSNGVYFLKVENENGLFTQKIMLNK